MDFNTEKGQWKIMQGAEADGRRASEQAHKVNICVNVFFFLSVIDTVLDRYRAPSSCLNIVHVPSVINLNCTKICYFRL
jgi:hypothetical protein